MGYTLQWNHAIWDTYYSEIMRYGIHITVKSQLCVQQLVRAVNKENTLSCLQAVCKGDTPLTGGLPAQMASNA